MSDTYGLTSSGFVSKRLADIRASLKTKIQAIVDPITGESIVLNDSDDSAISQIVSITASEISDAWQMLANIATQFDPRYNTGAAQSGVVQINGIMRNAAVPTEISVTLTGDSGSSIIANSLVSDTDGTMSFYLRDTVVLDGSGNGTGTFINAEKKSVVIADSAPLKIMSPQTGWTTATVITTTVEGNDEETDSELRVRQQASTALTSTTQSESIYAAVRNVIGVKYVRLYENNTVTDQSAGKLLYGKSIAVVVMGGNDDDIAKAIFRTAPVGIRYNGTTTVSVTETLTGIAYDVKFLRPTPVPIFVDVTVQSTGPDFPQTYATDIPQRIVDYATGGAGNIGIVSGFDRNGIAPGA